MRKQNYFKIATIIEKICAKPTFKNKIKLRKLLKIFLKDIAIQVKENLIMSQKMELLDQNNDNDYIEKTINLEGQKGSKRIVIENYFVDFKQREKTKMNTQMLSIKNKKYCKQMKQIRKRYVLILI